MAKKQDSYVGKENHPVKVSGLTTYKECDYAENLGYGIAALVFYGIGHPCSAGYSYGLGRRDV